MIIMNDLKAIAATPEKQIRSKYKLARLERRIRRVFELFFEIEEAQLLRLSAARG